MNRSDWQPIVAAMTAGGYWDRIMAGGPELERVRHYLFRFAGKEPPSCPHPMQDPQYPCFPGLRHAPFHDTAGSQVVATLERLFEVIRTEAMSLDEDSALDYSSVSGRKRSLRKPWTLLRPRVPPKSWTVYPFYHMGVNLEAVNNRCPKTAAIVESLPRLCAAYPWGDVIFSVQGPNSSLPPHCSVDNLRLRCHLGIDIPGDTGIRVERETRTWQAGKCLLFEDSFEHEVWNRSQRRRVVLIADFWHPDLTEIEIRALTAGFRKREVRQIFLRQRLAMTTSPDRYLDTLENAVAKDDAESVEEFWAR